MACPPPFHFRRAATSWFAGLHPVRGVALPRGRRTVDPAGDGRQDRMDLSVRHGRRMAAVRCSDPDVASVVQQPQVGRARAVDVVHMRADGGAPCRLHSAVSLDDVLAGGARQAAGRGVVAAGQRVGHFDPQRLRDILGQRCASEGGEGRSDRTHCNGLRLAARPPFAMRAHRPSPLVRPQPLADTGSPTTIAMPTHLDTRLHQGCTRRAPARSPASQRLASLKALGPHASAIRDPHAERSARMFNLDPPTWVGSEVGRDSENALGAGRMRFL